MGKTWDRIIIGIMSFGYLIISVFLVIVALGWTSPVYTLENYLLLISNRWLMGLTGMVLFIVSLTLFLGSFRIKPAKVAAIHETTLGTIKITITALEHLVLKSAQGVQGIREVKPLLKRNQNGLSIELKVQMMPDVDIPSITENLQKTVREYLLKTTGTTVQDIRILVNRISWDNKTRVE
jgi:uncharacterized alkaline shock family protein YloU